MAVTLSGKDIDALEGMFIDAKGRGFKPATMRVAVITRGLRAGWLRKEDGDFFSHKERGSHLVFTENGKANILKRMAGRHLMDIEDVHHLVRTGHCDMLTTATASRRETKVERAVQIGF